MGYRYRVEQRNKAVAIAAEIDQIQALSASQGLTLEQGLKELKRRGLNAVVIPEQYVAELLSNGDLQTVSGKFLTGPPELIQRVMRGVGIRYPLYKKTASYAGSSATTTAVNFSDLAAIRGVSVGLDPEQAKIAQDNGLMIVARCVNPTSASANTVTETIRWAKEMGAKVFLPEGDQVLGRHDELDTFIDALQKHEMWYASPEFSKIGGDENVVEKVPGIVLRLHSAQTQELDKMRLDEAVDRYARAARERNQRLLLLRPFSSAAEKPLTAFGDFVEKVKTETENQGSVVGDPHPFTEPGVPSVLFLAIALSVLPVALWTASAFIKSRGWLIFLGVIFTAVAAACYKPVGHPYMALLAALVFPTAAFLVLDGRKGKSWPVEYLVITLVSLTGGLAVAGLINGLPYYVHAQQFMGVKFAHFFPIVLIGAYFFYRFGLVKKSLSSPVEWGKALLALVILGGLGFMLARTGNDNPAAVSGVELKLRYLLDVILFVRPRTKEFLIGHPFLIVGIAALIYFRNHPQADKWKGWIALLLMLGAVGQTSIVNTMCHIHTPMVLSLARIGVGWVAGGIIGAVVWGVVRKFIPEKGLELG
jgi:hypothetical protein